MRILKNKKKPNGYWTKDRAQEEALKFSNKRDFYTGNYSAYLFACKKKILDKICKHMPAVSYSVAELKKEALKYRTRWEFQKQSVAAYLCAYRKGILDKICKHMSPASGSSIAEREIFKIIKNTHKEVTKLRDMKVNIPNKPYIRGFELDIFVPELNKGIEFDGTYYHSFECMRKTEYKNEWSDDDIRNYHEIKDSWFASKGIQILHIKEEDWIKDKEACIKQCFDFLSR